MWYCTHYWKSKDWKFTTFSKSCMICLLFYLYFFLYECMWTCVHMWVNGHVCACMWMYMCTEVRVWFRETSWSSIHLIKCGRLSVKSRAQQHHLCRLPAVSGDPLTLFSEAEIAGWPSHPLDILYGFWESKLSSSRLSARIFFFNQQVVSLAPKFTF